MQKEKCGECGKEIEIPTNSHDEYRATGLLCVCLEKPLCFECNMEMEEVHHEKSDKCCAFGFPKKGDWFYPKN